VVGDVLRVIGRAFAADGVVHAGQTLVDEALLTGESHPLARGIGTQVLSGSHNLSSTVQVRVERVGEATRFSQIVALMESASATKPQGAMLADRLAKPFLIGVLLAAAASAAWWWSRDPGHALMGAVAVLVVTCPCALSLATPAAMLASAIGSPRCSGASIAGSGARRCWSLATLTRDAMVLGYHGCPGFSAGSMPWPPLWRANPCIRFRGHWLRRRPKGGLRPTLGLVRQ
jgi:Cu2+-exporting ATPase